MLFVSNLRNVFHADSFASTATPSWPDPSPGHSITDLRFDQLEPANQDLSMCTKLLRSRSCWINLAARRTDHDVVCCTRFLVGSLGQFFDGFVVTTLPGPAFASSSSFANVTNFVLSPSSGQTTC